MIVLAGRIEPAFRRDLFAPLGHKADSMRLRGERDRQHLVRRGHFEIDRDMDRAGHALQVVFIDVAAILAHVQRHAISARCLRDARRAHGIGIFAAARVTDRRDMIDVHAETRGLSHAHAARPLLPGFTAGIFASSGGN